MAAYATRTLFRFALIMLIAAFATSLGNARAETAKTPVVVELFTSQACSSCPPADRLLGELAEHDNVIALSLPVDYWDHLAWKDTLGLEEHSERQRAYARRLGLASVGTPQIIVNGSRAIVGSRVQDVKNAVAAAARQEQLAVPIEIGAAGKSLHVRIGAGEASQRAEILVIPLLSARTVHVKRGENRGKTITYHNVSRKLMSVGTWNGEPKTLMLAHEEVMTGDTDHCAVILQDQRTGAILGAALLEEA